MASLPTNVMPQTGLRIDDKLLAATAAGDDCETGAGVYLVVDNADTVLHTATLETPGVIDGDLAIADRPLAVPAGERHAIPVTNRYRNPVTGRASITYDAVTAVTVGVFRAPVTA